MRSIRNTCISLLIANSLLLLISSCATIDLYEKTVSIPGHSWQNSFRPSLSFDIKDTTAPYQLFLILRHSDKYNYNNIYINLYVRQPGQDSVQKVTYDLPLGTNEAGWLASGMDDIYEHRILLTPAGQLFYFRKPGQYTFSVEQIMRENPLKQVLDVGLRVEKKQ